MARSNTVGGTDSPTPHPAVPMPLTALLDLVVITVFVLIGRSSHEEGLTILGVLQTLWPFVVGAAVGWSISYVFSYVRSTDWFGHDFRPDRIVPAGLVIWFCTVAVAMILRYLLHQGIAISFIIVASLFLALFLFGWRAAAAAVARRRA